LLNTVAPLPAGQSLWFAHVYAMPSFALPQTTLCAAVAVIALMNLMPAVLPLTSLWRATSPSTVAPVCL
jgi:hypothetical protein